MSYDTKVFNIMIASPGDVAAERSIVREVIYEWNAVHSFSRKIVLLPIGWESHSSPEMGVRPQELINKQVLDKCDLLVGVFWTRIGTPTNEYASGTIEEIEKHIDSGKPVMLYFSSQPVILDSVDLSQIQQLKDLKESCRTRGLYQEYDSHSDFKEKFYHHLQIKINEHPMFVDYNTHINNEIAESKIHFPTLSLEAKTLLKEASKDPNGTILLIRTLGGTHIQVNGKSFMFTDRRETAKWEAAITELIKNNLLLARGLKGEVFELSNMGYQISDMIEL